MSNHNDSGVEVEVTSTSLTLRLKHGRTTILLLAEELEPVSRVKQALLEVLRETYPHGVPASPASDGCNAILPPSSIKEIRLAIPTNLNDTSEGWTEIDTRSSAGAKATLRSLGLKEGSMLAFVLNGEEEFWAEFSDVNALYPEEDGEEA